MRMSSSPWPVAVYPDSGCPIYLGEDGERLLSADFK
jgi:hypothetical protein